MEADLRMHERLHRRSCRNVCSHLTCPVSIRWSPLCRKPNSKTSGEPVALGQDANLGVNSGSWIYSGVAGRHYPSVRAGKQARSFVWNSRPWACVLYRRGRGGLRSSQRRPINHATSARLGASYDARSNPFTPSESPDVSRRYP
ncbi:hypothetical protein LSAT2_006207 [Lamellibrachia satsuma]|nr:hypothetical protein LSAT2_006207 [Lamellibrachia satsuma]